MKGSFRERWSVRLALAGALLVVPFVCTAQESSESGNRRLEGIVLDQQGLPIPGAQIVVTGQRQTTERVTVSSREGFRVDGLPPAIYEIRVDASGFAPTAESVDLQKATSVRVEFRLAPGLITEQVIVTPTRSEQRLGDVPASVTVLHSEQIRQSPAVVADDVLRQSPTFSLFRRSSSLSSHPTGQGVSLRGIGPSGTSRTLVLLDDVPFNDPFGGWVYWTRVPLMSLDRVELVNGSTSSLYGNYAMGGVINIVTRRPERRTIEVRPQYGSRSSPKVDFFVSDQWNWAGLVVEGGVYDTDGFPVVAPSERGPIDINASVDYRTVSGKFQFTPTDRVNGFVRGSYFTEDRVNGKVGEVNDTNAASLHGGVQIRLADDSSLSARVFFDDQTFHSNFLAVTNPTSTRDLVRLATDQRVPTSGVGTLAQWSKPFGLHAFSAGADWRWVDGDSREDSYLRAVPTVIVPPVTEQAVLNIRRVSGGTQRSTGAFVQDVITPRSQLSITLNARIDYWRNYDAHHLETRAATGLPTANHDPALPDKEDTVVSPRVGALYHLTEEMSIWGGFGYGFRAPTLNELYRQFSVGATVTRANAELGPERLKGGEAGINLTPLPDLTIRTTWFDNRVKDSVGNVTIGTNLQQRQNIGRTRIWGIQTEGEYRAGTFWTFSAAYLYDRARVTGNPEEPALVGKSLPQVPEHRASGQLAFSHARYATVAVGVQFVGRQFDDDLNVRTVPPVALADAGYDPSTEPGLPGFALVDLMASRVIRANSEVFVGVQNLFDQKYFVQTNPSTYGTPRLVHAGVRLRFSGR
jgi:outer membrane receptor protein involved in Fe transport